MNSTNIAKRHQGTPVNILANIGTLAKTTPDLLDLSIGDPDIITDKTIIEAAFADVKAGHTKYTESGGEITFINAVIDFYKRLYHLEVAADQVRATVGASHAMYLALQVILDPGDEVILHEPFFSPYKEQIIQSQGVPVVVPTYEKDGFEIDIDLLEAAVSPKTKAFILNSPNNPTGAVFSKEAFAKIAALAEKYDFYIISDEVYDGFSFYSNFTPMLAFAPEHTILLGSLSKNFAMTGWRIGYMIAPPYINQVAKLLNEGITYSAPSPSQRAAIYALNHAETLIPQVTAIFQKRLEYIAERIAVIPYLSLHPVKGSMYAFVNITRTQMSSVPFSEYLLKETKVLVIPGLAFGESGDNYVRIAATQPIPILKEAFDRLEDLSF